MSFRVKSYSHDRSKTSVKNNEFLSIEDSCNMQKKIWYAFETKVNWGIVIYIVVLHLLCLYHTITFPYYQRKTLCVWLITMVILSGVGVTGGAHRFWCHRAFKAKTPLKIILAILFYSAGQHTIFSWVRDHRVHHKYTETPADPHNSNRGFWFSHVGWIMLKKRPEVIQKGNRIDMSDILNDPVVQFFDRNHVVLQVLLSIVVPVLVAVYFLHQDWKYSFISQVFLRYPWVLNITWSINSFAHMYGYRSYDKHIQPTENLLLTWASGGESSHNFHHVFPCDYKASEFKSVFFNATTCWIDMFAQIGWAYDLKQVTPEYIKKTVEKKGDGTHSLYSKPEKIESKI